MNKRENQIVKNYVDTIQKVMQQEGLSAEDAVQFIKDGNYTVMGKKVPGFLFPNISLANQNLNNPSPYAIIDPDNFDKSGNQIAFTNFSLEDAAKIAAGGFEDPEEGYPTGTTFTSTFKPAEAAQPNKILGGSQAEFNKMTGGGGRPIPVTDFQLGAPTVSQTAGGSAGTGIQDPSQIDPAVESKTADQIKAEQEAIQKAKDEADARKLAEAQAKAKAEAKAEAKRRAVEAARLQAIADAQRKKDEAEENRKKAREEAIAAKAEQRDRAIKESKDRFVQKTGMRRAKGGIASKKPKKKVMKRGGLASKK